jgi:hypothetical protein
MGGDFADRICASLQKKGFWLSSACPANADVGYCRTSTKSEAGSSGKHPNSKWQRHDWAKSAIQSTGEAPAEKTFTACSKQEKTVADHCHRSLDSDYPHYNQALGVIALRKREQHAILPPKPTVEI